MRNNIKNLALASLASQLVVAPLALSCGPFDYVVYSKKSEILARGASRESSTLTVPKLAAIIGGDSTRIYADTGFYDDRESTWNLAHADAELTRINTLIEFGGFFESALYPDLQGKDADDPAKVKKLADDRKKFFDEFLALKEVEPAFEGISVKDLQAMRNASESSEVVNAIQTAYGSDSAKAKSLIDAVIAKNTGAPAQAFVSRPAYLSSKLVPSQAASCMAIGYGQDYFTNSYLRDYSARKLTPALMRKYRNELDGRSTSDGGPRTTKQYRDEQMSGVFGKTFAKSIVDLAAAASMQKDRIKDGKLIKGDFELDGLGCKLVESDSYALADVPQTRCGGGPDVQFHQKNPVVRLSPDNEQELIQVGTQVYTVQCASKPGGPLLNLSQISGDPKRLAPLIEKMAAAAKASGAQSTIADGIAALSNMPPKSTPPEPDDENSEAYKGTEAKILAASFECTNIFREKVLGMPRLPASSAPTSATGSGSADSATK